MSELDKAIEMFSAATEGSRELDAYLGWAINWRPDSFQPDPHFSTNLQDAVDAIPEGWWLENLHNRVRIPAERVYQAEIRQGETYRGLEDLFEAVAPTPSLALCLAILRALKAQQDSRQQHTTESGA